MSDDILSGEDVVDEVSFESAYDRWRDDCAMKLCADIERVAVKHAQDKTSYFHKHMKEVWRCIEVHSTHHKNELKEL